MDNKSFLDKTNQKEIFPFGTDLNAAAITGARVGLSKFDKVCVLIAVKAATSPVDEFTLKQHTAVSGGTSKVLSTINPHYIKLLTADIWTKVEPASARSLLDMSATFGNGAAMLAIEVRGDELDQDNGYGWFSVDIADSTAAQLGMGLYILQDPRNAPAYNVVTT